MCMFLYVYIYTFIVVANLRNVLLYTLPVMAHVTAVVCIEKLGSANTSGISI